MPNQMKATYKDLGWFSSLQISDTQGLKLSEGKVNTHFSEGAYAAQLQGSVQERLQGSVLWILMVNNFCGRTGCSYPESWKKYFLFL